jgi:carbon storage regulator
MLVLTRKPGQSIRIGDDITVTVVGVDDRGSVQIGITAPREVPIVRDDANEKSGR